MFTSGQDRVSLVWGLPAAVAKNLVDGRVNNAVDLSVVDTLKAPRTRWHIEPPRCLGFGHAIEPSRTLNMEECFSS